MTEQKKLDRSEVGENRDLILTLDNKLRNIRDAGWIAHEKGESVPEVYNTRKQILSLIEPLIEEAKKGVAREIICEVAKHPVFLKNCKSNRARGCKICGDCPFSSYLKGGGE